MEDILQIRERISYLRDDNEVMRNIIASPSASFYDVREAKCRLDENLREIAHLADKICELKGGKS